MLGRKINIDKYSIAVITRLGSEDSLDFLRVHSLFDFEKFAIINNKIKEDSNYHYKKFKEDVLTGEKYYLDSDYCDEINTLYVDPRYRLIPLSHVIKSDNGKIKKKEFLKRCREIIITLNEKSLDDNQEQVIDKIKNKEKVLKLENFKITYKEEE